MKTKNMISSALAIGTFALAIVGSASEFHVSVGSDTSISQQEMDKIVKDYDTGLKSPVIDPIDLLAGVLVAPVLVFYKAEWEVSKQVLWEAGKAASLEAGKSALNDVTDAAGEKVVEGAFDIVDDFHNEMQNQMNLDFFNHSPDLQGELHSPQAYPPDNYGSGTGGAGGGFGGSGFGFGGSGFGGGGGGGGGGGSGLIDRAEMLQYVA